MEQVLEHVFDHRGRTPKKLGTDWVDSGVQVISAKSVSRGRLNLNREGRYVDEATFHRWMPVKLRPGDVLLTSEAPLGEATYLRSDEPLCLGQRLFALRTLPDVAASRYLYYFLQSPAGGAALQARASGTTVLGIRQSELLKVAVPLPTLAVQVRVAGILGAIDDLIENNRRRIELLEQMAQAIYEEWFVRFRFPGHDDATFIDSALGPIPEGWQAKALGAIAALDRTTSQPSRSPEEEFDHYSIPAFDAGRLPAVERGDSIKSGKFFVTHAAVLVSKLNPRIERTWLVEPRAVVRSVASTEFLVIRPSSGHSLEYLYLLARSTLFQDRLRELSAGTSTSHQRAKPDAFMALPVIVPPPELVATATDAFSPQLRSTAVLLGQSRRLAAMRDLLLPKLVTGQIDVSHLDLDALVEAVAAS